MRELENEVVCVGMVRSHRPSQDEAPVVSGTFCSTSGTSE